MELVPAPDPPLVVAGGLPAISVVSAPVSDPSAGPVPGTELSAGTELSSAGSVESSAAGVTPPAE